MASRRLRALQSRDFKLLALGQLVSLTGTQMQQVALAWQIYLLTKSPVALGLLGAARVIPVIVFALGGGVVADALDRRRVLLVSQSAMASVSIALAVLSATGRATPLAIYGLVAASAMAFAVDAPARQALLPHLVEREDLPSALSLYNMVWQTASIVGPALGGVALAGFGVVAVYAIDAASYAAVIAALLLMRVSPSAKRGELDLRAALDGLRFLRRSPVILSTMVLDFVATFLAGALLLLPIYADQILTVGERGLGILFAAPAAGAVLAGAIMSLRAPRPRGKTVLIAVALYGAAVAAFGASRWFWISFLCLAASGAADAVSTVVRQTLRQLFTPDELRGRMTAVNMIFFIGGPQLGEVEAGLLARAFGARVSVVSGGLLCFAAALVAALVVPSLRVAEWSRPPNESDQNASQGDPVGNLGKSNP